MFYDSNDNNNLIPFNIKSGYSQEAPPFTYETARMLIESNSKFPVPLDYAGQWAGYARKDNAVHALLALGLVENNDFEIFRSSQGNSRGRPREDYSLSVRSFKTFLAKAHTDQGSKYLGYLIDSEEQLQEIKQHGYKIPQTLPESYREIARLCQAAAEAEEAKLLAESRVKTLLPPAELGMRIAEGKKNYSMAETAALINEQVAPHKKLGRNKLIEILKRQGIMVKKPYHSSYDEDGDLIPEEYLTPEQRIPHHYMTQAKQIYIDRGLFVVSVDEYENAVTRVTAKGLEWLVQKLIEWGYAKPRLQN